MFFVYLSLTGWFRMVHILQMITSCSNITSGPQGPSFQLSNSSFPSAASFSRRTASHGRSRALYPSKRHEQGEYQGWFRGASNLAWNVKKNGLEVIPALEMALLGFHVKFRECTNLRSDDLGSIGVHRLNLTATQDWISFQPSVKMGWPRTFGDLLRMTITRHMGVWSWAPKNCLETYVEKICQIYPNLQFQTIGFGGTQYPWVANIFRQGAV